MADMMTDESNAKSDGNFQKGGIWLLQRERPRILRDQRELCSQGIDD
jgi:hypothetical protein